VDLANIRRQTDGAILTENLPQNCPEREESRGKEHLQADGHVCCLRTEWIWGLSEAGVYSCAYRRPHCSAKPHKLQYF